jgi:hypothetical protein
MKANWSWSIYIRISMYMYEIDNIEMKEMKYTAWFAQECSCEQMFMHEFWCSLFLLV